MNYRNATSAQLKALPDTYGIPVGDAYTLRVERDRAKQAPAYELDYSSATAELDAALRIGLPNYGSCIASWQIPRIIKANKNANKHAQMWHLYVTQVCGAAYTPAQINAAWRKYTPEQQATINGKLEAYLNGCFEYLVTAF